MFTNVQKESSHGRRSPERVSFEDALHQGTLLLSRSFFRLLVHLAGDIRSVYLHRTGFYGKKFANVKEESHGISA